MDQLFRVLHGMELLQTGGISLKINILLNFSIYIFGVLLNSFLFLLGLLMEENQLNSALISAPILTTLIHHGWLFN